MFDGTKTTLTVAIFVLCAHPLTEHWHTKTNRFSLCVRDWAHKPGEEGLTDLQKKVPLMIIWWQISQFTAKEFSLPCAKSYVFLSGVSYLWSDKRIAE